MGECKICNASSRYISQELAVCLACIRDKPADALKVAAQAHMKSRMAFGLPVCRPDDPDGIPCNLCVNECRIPDGGIGYCGLRRNAGGKLTGVTKEDGKLSWYHDPLPTNCVADWVCPGGVGSGYPEYAHVKGPEYGYRNLAVFFHACSFNCLFCQNWHYRKETLRPYISSSESLVSAVDSRTSCICYFGGDPAPQLPFSLNVSKCVREKNKGNIVRICWETNGSMQEGLLDAMVETALDSGGCIKFDLKAWNEDLHIALTGVTNKRTLKNFKRVGGKIHLRPSPPLLIASTLLVPGYIDEEEVRQIARFIYSLCPDIPYSLLAFYPHFYMSDLLLTPKSFAYKCLEIARKEGLNNVRLGNIHLLK